MCPNTTEWILRYRTWTLRGRYYQFIGNFIIEGLWRKLKFTSRLLCLIIDEDQCISGGESILASNVVCFRCHGMKRELSASQTTLLWDIRIKSPFFGQILPYHWSLRSLSTQLRKAALWPFSLSCWFTLLGWLGHVWFILQKPGKSLQRARDQGRREFNEMEILDTSFRWCKHSR